jgi:hypothetical protein
VVDHFTEAVDKLVFFVQMKERLSARGKSWVRRWVSVRRGRAFSQGWSMSVWGGEACCTSALGVRMRVIVSSLKRRWVGRARHRSTELLCWLSTVSTISLFQNLTGRGVGSA